MKSDSPNFIEFNAFTAEIGGCTKALGVPPRGISASSIRFHPDLVLCLSSVSRARGRPTTCIFRFLFPTTHVIPMRWMEFCPGG